MIAALLAAAAVSAPYDPAAAADPLPALGALGPQPAAATVLTALAGRPFSSVRLDHGFGDVADLGAGLDVSPDGFYRPTVQGRLRVFRIGRTQLGLRGTVGHVFGGNGSLIQTTDGELALRLAFAPLERLAGFGEVSLLGASDFTREHTAGFVQAQGGLAFVPPGPFALLASAGVLQGVRGGRAVGSGGVALRF